MRRRLGIAAIVALVALLLGAVLAWLFWVPSAVESRIQEAAARRGLEVSVGGVDAGLSSVELRSVSISGRDVLSVDLASVVIGAGVWELATQGRSAIRRITVSGARVRLRVHGEELAAVLAELRGTDVADTSDQPVAAEWPLVDIDDVHVTVRDSVGTLLTVEGAEAHLLSRDVLRVNTDAITLAPGENEGATVASSTLRVHDEADEGWQVDSLIVREVALAYREREAGDESPVWTRARQAIATVREIWNPQDPHGPRDSVEDSSGGDADEPSRLASLARIARSVGPRLAPGASLRLEGLEVVARSETGERRVLRELVSEARALPEGRYRLEGEGRPGRGGRLGWDLTVDPDALRAEGELNFQRLPFALLVPFLPDLPWYRAEDTTLTGELSIRGDSASSVHLAGEASIHDLALNSSRIAPTPVRRISASFSGEADWLPLSRRLEVSGATVGLGQARAQITGSLEWPEDHYLIDATATLPPTDCNTAVGAIPADLLAELNGFTFRGQIGGQVVVRVDSRALDETTLDIDVADGCTFVTAPGMADVSRFSTSFVHRVVEPDGTEFTMETGPETLNWSPISQISPFMIQAVLGHEDGAFFRHSGFSVPSIRLALIRNLREGRYVYGASTITMQLVKNVFLHREKTLARKVQEVLLTWWLESVMEKSDILELYLNVIEYGPEIYGIRAAAMHYFGRTPASLGPAESAYIATILPNPPEFHSQWEDNELPASHRRRLARFIRTLGSRHRYDAEAVAFALTRLEDFRFHRPGEPVGLPPEHRGHTGALPIETAVDPHMWDSDERLEDLEAPFDDEPMEDTW